MNRGFFCKLNKALIDATDEVAGEHVVLGAAEAVEAGREAEAVRKGLLEVDGSEDVLHVLGTGSLEVFVVVTVLDPFAFEDDAVNNLRLDRKSTRLNSSH